MERVGLVYSRCFVDYHMHTDNSPDCDETIENMCKAALKTGLKRIAITDHVEVSAFYSDKYDHTGEISYTQAGKMQKLYDGKIFVARGVELGEPMHDVKTAEKFLDTHNFDFILGSIHNLMGEKDFYHFDYSCVDVRDLMDRYFLEILKMIKWGRFNSLAHITYPFRYIPKGLYPSDYHFWMDEINTILKTLVVKGIALEINTSGLRQSLGKTIPELFLIKRFNELGGEMITIGSDAHFSEHVGKNIEDGIRIASQAGFRYIAAFANGKAEMLPID